MRAQVLTMALAATVAGWACGGGGSTYGAPTATPTAPSATPTPPTTGTSGITVNIVASTGSGAYNPNPVPAKMGDTIVFHNADSTTHHIVMDDGSKDLGNITPGGNSQMQLNSAGGNFHCTIHPSMVGSINGSVMSSPDPCPGGYCLGDK